MDNISKGVMKVSEWKGTSILYRIACSCGGGDDCSSDIEFEFDKDFGFLNINFYKTISWNDYRYNNNFITRFWSRLKAAIRVLFTGYVSVEGSFMVQDIDHIDSIITAFNEGKSKIIQFKDDFDKENNQKLYDSKVVK